MLIKNKIQRFHKDIKLNQIDFCIVE